MKRKRQPRNYQRRTAIDRASGNTFELDGPRGYRKSKPACLNGSYRRVGRKTRSITLAARA